MSYSLLNKDYVINVSVDGFESYAFITWQAIDTDREACDGSIVIPTEFSQKVYIDPLKCGQPQRTLDEARIPATAWGGDYDVKYQITQRATENCDCDPYKPMQGASHSIGIISSMTMPYFLEGEKDTTHLNVTYYDSVINECGYERVTTGVTSVEIFDTPTTCSSSSFRNGTKNVNINGKTFQVDYEFYHSKPVSCNCNTDEPITDYGRATYEIEEVPASGINSTTAFKMSVPFVIIEVHDCVETRTLGVSSCTVTKIEPNTECYTLTEVYGKTDCSGDLVLLSGLTQTYDPKTCEGDVCEVRTEYRVKKEHVTNKFDENAQIELSSDVGNQLSHSFEEIFTVTGFSLDNVESFELRINGNATYNNLFRLTSTTYTMVSVSDLQEQVNGTWVPSTIDVIELLSGNSVTFYNITRVMSSDASYSIGINGIDWGLSVECCQILPCTFEPRNATGRGGTICDFVVQSHGTEIITPDTMMPYYGGVAHVRVKFTATTTNQDCSITNTYGNVDVPIEVESITREMCGMDGGEFCDDSYEITYKGKTLLACIAQSTDCMGEGTVTCNPNFHFVQSASEFMYLELTNVMIGNYGKACVFSVNATAQESWIHIQEDQLPFRNQIIIDKLDRNDTGAQRSGLIEITYEMTDGSTGTCTAPIIQKKQDVYCNCYDMFEDVPTDEFQAYVSGRTDLVSHGGANGIDLWVFHVSKTECQSSCTVRTEVSTDDGATWSETTNSIISQKGTHKYGTTNYTAVSANVLPNDSKYERLFRAFISFDGSTFCSAGTRSGNNIIVRQEAKPCEITSINCVPSNAMLSPSVTSVSTQITVVGNNVCENKWKATIVKKTGGSQTITGNSGDSLTVDCPQTVRICSEENDSKCCEFNVTEQVCEITSIVCEPSSAVISESETTVSSIVTVTGNEVCEKKWTATIQKKSGGQETIEGNSGDSIEVDCEQTVTIKSVENGSITCTFVVSETQPVCEVTSITCNPTSAKIMALGESVYTVVTVNGNNICDNTWTANVLKENNTTQTVTGNSGDRLYVDYPQTVRIVSNDDNTKTTNFTVSEDTIFEASPLEITYTTTGSSIVNVTSKTLRGEVLPFSIASQSSQLSGDVSSDYTKLYVIEKEGHNTVQGSIAIVQSGSGKRITISASGYCFSFNSDTFDLDGCDSGNVFLGINSYYGKRSNTVGFTVESYSSDGNFFSAATGCYEIVVGEQCVFGCMVTCTSTATGNGTLVLKQNDSGKKLTLNVVKRW